MRKRLALLTMIVSLNGCQSLRGVLYQPAEPAPVPLPPPPPTIQVMPAPVVIAPPPPVVVAPPVIKPAVIVKPKPKPKPKPVVKKVDPPPVADVPAEAPAPTIPDDKPLGPLEYYDIPPLIKAPPVEEPCVVTPRA